MSFRHNRMRRDSGWLNVGRLSAIFGQASFHSLQSHLKRSYSLPPTLATILEGERSDAPSPRDLSSPFSRSPTESSFDDIEYDSDDYSDSDEYADSVSGDSGSGFPVYEYRESDFSVIPRPSESLPEECSMMAQAETEFQKSLQRNSPRKQSPRKVSLRTQTHQRKPRFKFNADGFSLFWGKNRKTTKLSGKALNPPVNEEALREMFSKSVPEAPKRSRRYAKVFSGESLLMKEKSLTPDHDFRTWRQNYFNHNRAPEDYLDTILARSSAALLNLS